MGPVGELDGRGRGGGGVLVVDDKGFVGACGGEDPGVQGEG